jgi:hypothetical protein
MKSQISLNRRSAAKHLDKLLDDALEQHSGQRSGRD